MAQIIIEKRKPYENLLLVMISNIIQKYMLVRITHTLINRMSEFGKIEKSKWKNIKAIMTCFNKSMNIPLVQDNSQESVSDSWYDEHSDSWDSDRFLSDDNELLSLDKSFIEWAHSIVLNSSMLIYQNIEDEERNEVKRLARLTIERMPYCN